jgi:hypothetical protein
VKKRFYITTALALAIISSGGIYAYTYTTTTSTIGVSEPTGDVSTVNTTATQPDWDSVLTPVTDSEIFRPNAAGDETEIETQFPATGDHWDKVDEVTSDNDTYVATNKSSYEEDLYNIRDHSTQTAGGTINYVVIYMVDKAESSAEQVSAYIHIKTNGAEYNGTSENLTTSYASYSNQWDDNPQTGGLWTWSEIDALQIGVGMRKAGTGLNSYATQVYSDVNFDAPPLSGSTPTEDLFEITPHADYSGDLSVRVYLTNTEALTRAYKVLSMQLYLEGSVEAGETPNYQTLTLQNGVAFFNLVGFSGGSYTLSVNGGSYTLVSREISEWEAGYTVTPELYCEVTQR